MSGARPNGISPGRRLLFVVVIAVALGLIAELAARLTYRVTSASTHPARQRGPALDPYEMVDADNPGLWRLRPGFRQTMDELIAAKEAEGKVLAVRHYREARRRLGIPGNRLVLRVNERGYRGPEISDPPRALRVLALGDSCTFGTIEDYTYPRVLERELSARFPVEVINAGVEGYGPGQVLERIDEFRALKPDLTLVYIGWNALYGERPPFLEPTAGKSGRRRTPSRLYTVRLLSRAFRTLRPRQAALSDYEREKRPDPADPGLVALDDWVPSFMGQVETIVDEMQRGGSEVVLVTLPGLYASDEEPSPRALAIGHLPAFTDNPYILARMAERYNERLRALAARRELRLIDLARWSRRALEQRDRLFIDSVHLVEEGQAELGRYLAAELLPHLSDAG